MKKCFITSGPDQTADVQTDLNLHLYLYLMLVTRSICHVTAIHMCFCFVFHGHCLQDVYLKGNTKLLHPDNMKS